MLDNPAAEVLHRRALPEFIRQGFVYKDEDTRSEHDEDAEVEADMEYDSEEIELTTET